MKTLDRYEIPDKVVDEIRYRIKQMSRDEIDKFYHEIGFIVTDAEDDCNKALTDKQLDSIEEGADFMIDNLIRDVDKDTLEEIVDKLKQSEEEDFGEE